MSDHGSVTPLSIWDQSTSRFHIRLVLCFQVANHQREQVENHLRKSLKHLSRQRPDLAGKLHLGARKGWVYLRKDPKFRIQFDTYDIQKEFEYTYQELRDEKFPARAFVHPRFGYLDLGKIESAESRVPVAAVRAFFVDGGMLLATFLHHTFGDGECMREFLDAFAAATRGEHTTVEGTRCLEFTRREIAERPPSSFDQLLGRCPEFIRTEAHLGPNQPTLRPGGRPETSYKRDGRIFVFTTEKIRELKEIVCKHALSNRPPSSYVVLATLIWAHAAKARLATEEHAESWGDKGSATLTNPVDWRRRAFVPANSEYYGNGATLAQTRVNTEDLVNACGDEAEWARVVRRMQGCIAAVDDEFVRARVEMFGAAGDPRELGLVMDPRVPMDLAFNTWREFGADTRWDLGVRHANGVKGVNGVNGVNGAVENGSNGMHVNGGTNGIGGGGGVKPDKLRRSQDYWNIGGTLILPARDKSDVWEVLLTIPKPAMELLRGDEGFMKWVDDVLS